MSLMTTAAIVTGLLVLAAALSWLLNLMAPKSVPPWKPITAGIVVVVALVFGLAYLQANHEADASDSDQPAPEGGSVPSLLVGGCETFQVYAQDQFEAYGASGRSAPNATSRKVASFDPNEIIAVDGWVLGQQAYPTNPAPWDSAVWFHLADDSGWVSFAAVRAYPTGPVTDRLGGHGPVPVDPSCGGSVRPR